MLKNALSPLEQNLQITLTKKCYKIAKSVGKKFWSCIGEIFLQFLSTLAPPTVRKVLAVRLQFHLLIEHLDLILTNKYLQDISIIGEDMKFQT